MLLNIEKFRKLALEGFQVLTFIVQGGALAYKGEGGETKEYQGRSSRGGTAPSMQVLLARSPEGKGNII